MSRYERKRAPSTVFGSISLAILVLIMTALNQSQPPPPPTPEYAPEAVQAIKDAPKEQTSRSGTGDVGTGGGGDGGTGSTGGTRKIDRKRVRYCLGDPPRQIEDTQSPPCVPYFDGPNGGATSPGVTADEIRIAVPAVENSKVLALLLRFFNQRFEFYNRKLVVVGVSGCGNKKPSDMRACAEAAKAQNVFASLSYSDVGGNQQFYYDRLAELGIISVGSHPDRRTEAHLARHDPYQWAYLPSYDKIGRHVASYVCSQLQGRNATHGGADVVAMRRSFAFVTNTYSDAPEPDNAALLDGLRGCGVTPKKATVDFEQEGAGYQQENERTAQQAANAVTRFHTEGVTTIVCMCHTTTTKQLLRVAEAQGYQPEWLINSFGYQDGNYFWSAQPPGQSAHTFGLSFWNKQVEPQNTTWYWATQYVDPGFDWEGNPFVFYAAHYLYHQLLVLASGIQMAGPNLTPQTFRDGLWDTEFPNPPGPYFEGTAGFSGRDHTFVDDAAIVWWDPSGRDPWVATPGAFCYVRSGERNDIGRYPRSDEAFSPRVCPR